MRVQSNPLGESEGPRRVWGGHESKEGHERGWDPRKNSEAERHTKILWSFSEETPLILPKPEQFGIVLFFTLRGASLFAVI